MHFNPCGKAVDIARRPYTTACRFFKDSDVEVQVKWYPCVEPVECLPFPSKINSLDWSSFPELAEGVGEVYGSPRTYNGAKAIPYAHGLTPCEPAQVFSDGDTYDPARPPQQYDELGLALCCLNRFVSTGGLLWGGTAIVNVVTPSTPGNTCLTALIVSIPSTFVASLNVGDFSWFMAPFSVPSFGTYTVHVSVSVLSGPGGFNAALRRSLVINATQSGACSNSLGISFMVPGNSSIGGTLNVGGWWAGLVFDPVAVPTTVQVTWSVTSP